MIAVIRVGGRPLVLHPVVLGPHRDGPHVHAVSEVPVPPLRGRHSLAVVLLLDLGQRAVATGLRDHPLDLFRGDPRGVIADVDEVSLPVEVDLGYARLLS
jgi:hypothetical protein